MRCGLLAEPGNRVTLFIFPFIMTMWMSLHHSPVLGPANFLGAQDYVDMTCDGRFWSSLWFTTLETLLDTPPIFVLAFVLALLVNTALRGIGIFRTIYFIPSSSAWARPACCGLGC